MFLSFTSLGLRYSKQQSGIDTQSFAKFIITSLKLDFPSQHIFKMFLNESFISCTTIATVADIWDFLCHIEKKGDPSWFFFTLFLLIVWYNIIEFKPKDMSCFATQQWALSRHKMLSPEILYNISYLFLVTLNAL